MNKIVSTICGALIAFTSTLFLQSDLQAQYPIAVQAVGPVVVGYAPERRGLFGQRTVYRPLVAPVATAAPVVTVARPVVAAPIAVGYAPPVVAGYAPPVAAYYAPPAPVAVPVQAYRVPVHAHYPLFGF